MNEKTISIIIVSYNSQDVIDDCIRSIRKNNDIGDRLEIIVVEQSTGDQIYQDLTRKYRDIQVIRAENKGFGAGNNNGARHAKGSILFFLNPDTIVEEPLFSCVERRFKENSRMGLMGVHLISEQGDNISFNMRFPYGLAAKVKSVLYKRINKFYSRQMYIEGADLIIRKDAFQKIGGFDEKIFMYGEEMDLCWRIGEAGYQIQYEAGKTIRHLQGKCTEDRYPTVFAKQLDSFVYVCRKHGFNYRKWIKKEQCYQRLRSGIMRLTGHTAEAEQALRLYQTAKDKAQGEAL